MGECGTTGTWGYDMKECESGLPIVSDGYISSDLSSWARQGVLLLNTSLTVRAHEANSHSKRGWETFTERVIKLVVDRLSKSGGEAGAKGVCFLAWGAGAGKLVKGISPVRRLRRGEIVTRQRETDGRRRKESLLRTCLLIFPPRLRPNRTSSSSDPYYTAFRSALTIS